jgi:hypothetical protein
VLAQTIVQFSAEPPPLFLAETSNGIFEFPAALSLLLKLTPRSTLSDHRITLQLQEISEKDQ